MVEQFKIQYQKLKEGKYNYWDKITEITMNSELFVIDGIDSKKALSMIHELSF